MSDYSVVEVFRPQKEIFFRCHIDDKLADMVVVPIEKELELSNLISLLTCKATVVPINYAGLPKITDSWFDFVEISMFTLSEIIDKKIEEIMKKLPIGSNRNGYRKMLIEALENKFRIPECALRIAASKEPYADEPLKEYIYSIFDEVIGRSSPDIVFTEEDVKEALEKGEMLPSKFFGATPVIEMSQCGEKLFLCHRRKEYRPYAVIYIEDKRTMQQKAIKEALQIYKKLYAEAYYCNERELLLMIDREEELFEFAALNFGNFRDRVLKYIEDQHENDEYENNGSNNHVSELNECEF